jgi:hypothetical protein
MPAMSDARAFTSYLSAGQREQSLQTMAGVINETQYRQFLQRNATTVATRMQTLPLPASHRTRSGK